nr:hypothetical protein GCM10010200_017600 [Actinomadura rugatobispora]
MVARGQRDGFPRQGGCRPWQVREGLMQETATFKFRPPGKRLIQPRIVCHPPTCPNLRRVGPDEAQPGSHGGPATTLRVATPQTAARII